MNSLVRGLWNGNRFRCFLFFLVLPLTLGSLSTAAALSSPDVSQRAPVRLRVSGHNIQSVEV